MNMSYEDWYKQYVEGTAAQDKDEVWKKKSSDQVQKEVPEERMRLSVEVY